MERTKRRLAWLVVLTAALAACAEGDGDLSEGDAPPPAEDASPGDDVEGTEDADDAAPADDVEDASVDPDVSTGKDAAAGDATTPPPDAGPGELDGSAPDAFVPPDAPPPMDASVDPDVPVTPDAAVTPDVPTSPDVPTNPDGGCPTGSSSCSGACVDHAATTSTCAAAVSLGSYCGDTSCAFLCGGTSYRAVQTRTGRSTQWFQVRVNECSNCPASLVSRVRLTVPAGVDYDLFVHRPCGRITASSIANAGLPDQVEVRESDDPLSGDSYTYFIEVRYVSGSSCSPWTLTLDARANGGSSC